MAKLFFKKLTKHSMSCDFLEVGRLGGGEEEVHRELTTLVNTLVHLPLLAWVAGFNMFLYALKLS